MWLGLTPILKWRFLDWCRPFYILATLNLMRRVTWQCRSVTTVSTNNTLWRSKPLRILNTSLMCRRILAARVHIFVLGRHFGFGNCRGLGRVNVCQGNSHTPPLLTHLFTNPLPVKRPIIIQDGGFENLVYRVFRSKITTILQASEIYKMFL